MTRADLGVTWADPSPADQERFSPPDVFEAGLRNHAICNTAYPIAHQTTWRPYRVRRDDERERVQAAWAGVRDMGLYAHIPFCETRCYFCEYTVVDRREHDRVGSYMDDLLTELELYAEAIGTRDRVLHGFDIGGGTPAFVPAPQIARLVAAVRARFAFAPGADLSIETTPKIAAAEPAKLQAYREAGIDRVSMGVQVTQPDLLLLLNRQANGVEQHQRAVENVRGAGFERFNIDLMYGFADQSLESWRATLGHTIGLGPEYVTLYRMRYKLTRISHQASRVDPAAVQAQAVLAKELLSAAGYSANPGKTTYSRIPGDVGTSSYLAGRVRDGLPYVGLGLGAQSFSPTTISYNSGAAGKNIEPYRRRVARGELPIQDLYDLPARQVMAKFCAVSFYFGEIDRGAFERKFGQRLEQAFPREIAFLLERGLMIWTERALALTPAGAANKSGVHGLFHAPSVQRYLIERDATAGDDLQRNRRRALAVAREPVAGA